MGKIFGVELSNGKGQHRELNLPATDYELLDAFDQLQMDPSEKPGLEIIDYTDFEAFDLYLNNGCGLFELNKLARGLDGLDQGQIAAFTGLCQMLIQKGEAPPTILDLLTFANSTDCCHVVPEALNDSQLGYFYAANGFVPEVEDVPDSIFEILDFEQIGRKARIAEGGVYTEYGYVMRHNELKQAPPIPEGPPQRPPYIFRLTLINCSSGEDYLNEHPVTLERPATGEELYTALVKLDVPSWDEVIIAGYDGAVPLLDEIADSLDGISQLNELAYAVKQIIGRNEFPKFKAVLEATECTGLDDMIELTGQLDQYILEPDHQTYEDIAMTDLRVTVGEPALEQLIPHVNLYAYGQTVAEKMNLTLSSYGMVCRSDGLPIQTFDSDGPQRSGMEVMM